MGLYSKGGDGYIGQPSPANHIRKKGEKWFKLPFFSLRSDIRQFTPRKPQLTINWTINLTHQVREMWDAAAPPHHTLGDLTDPDIISPVGGWRLPPEMAPIPYEPRRVVREAASSEPLFLAPMSTTSSFHNGLFTLRKLSSGEGDVGPSCRPQSYARWPERPETFPVVF